VSGCDRSAHTTREARDALDQVGQSTVSTLTRARHSTTAENYDRSSDFRDLAVDCGGQCRRSRHRTHRHAGAASPADALDVHQGSASREQRRGDRVPQLSRGAVPHSSLCQLQAASSYAVGPDALPVHEWRGQRSSRTITGTSSPRTKRAHTRPGRITAVSEEEKAPAETEIVGPVTVEVHKCITATKHDRFVAGDQLATAQTGEIHAASTRGSTFDHASLFRMNAGDRRGGGVYLRSRYHDR